MILHTGNFPQQVPELHTRNFDTRWWHTGFASHYGDGSWFGNTRPDLDMRVEILVDEVKALPVGRETWWYWPWYGDNWYITAKINMRLRFWVTKQDGVEDLALEVHLPSAEAVFNAVGKLWGREWEVVSVSRRRISYQLFFLFLVPLWI